eukprot:TRINITY_DN5428_c0_g1_i8.p1 TRINITY_DN5428_c0_g1~~TRINITY_DN5428_c0_g1_i8.p1  ORF type:complete len:311 (-),score=44.98 TRINITY_DN5428_c0_g1_i8:78-1010(-)
MSQRFIVFLLLCFIVLHNFSSEHYTTHSKGVIVITGASTGIGRHATIEMVKAGYVVFAGVRNSAHSSELKAEVSKLQLSGEVHPIILDVTEDQQIASSFLEVEEYLNKTGMSLVGLVNNAGISTRYPVESIPEKHAKYVWEVNYWGVIKVTQKFLPLIRRDSARIVVVSSIAALIAAPGSSIYSGTKIAIERVMDALRRELRHWKVSVSIVEPGYVKTPILDKVSGDKFLVTEEQYKIYNKFWDQVLVSRSKSFEGAPGPEVTSEVIKHALVDPHPKTRYCVGVANNLPGWLICQVAPFLPDRWIDNLVG